LLFEISPILDSNLLAGGGYAITRQMEAGIIKSRQFKCDDTAIFLGIILGVQILTETAGT